MHGMFPDFIQYLIDMILDVLLFEWIMVKNKSNLYYCEENKPEKMECEDSLSAQQIWLETRRKLLKYQRKRWSTEQEEMMDSLMND